MTFDGSGSEDPDETTLSYSWGFPSGTCDMQGVTSSVSSGRFMRIGNQSVSLEITDNDNPDCSSECDDRTDTADASVNVLLPSGCQECNGNRAFDLHVTPHYYPHMELCYAGDCGSTSFDGYLDITLSTPCYRNGVWEVPVYANKDIFYGPCDFHNVINEGAVSEDVNASNYCQIVNGFKNSTGCVGLNGEKYSVIDCIDIHEGYHVDEYKDRIENQEVILRNTLGMIGIYCDDPASFTCQTALEAHRIEIEQAITSAFIGCIRCGEEGAVELAQECFNDAAANICAKATAENWPACSSCE